MLDLLFATAAATASPELSRPLEPLAFLVGQCWEGSLATGERDVHCFEPVFGGKHVRDRHEVSGGSGTYAGETFYSADGADALGFTYFNSLGGVSRGTMRKGADGLHFGEEHYKGADGKRIKLEVSWSALGTDAYEVTTKSADAPAMNGKVRYERMTNEIAVEERRAIDGSLLLIHEAIVEASIEDVWRTISTPDGWREWAVPVARAPEADVMETSYDPAAQPGGPATIRHRVLARVPGRMLAFRTIKAPEGFPHFDVFGRTTGVFELEPAGEGRTRVRTVGAGYPDNEAGRQLVAFFREGNRITLERLQRRFTDGPLDWAKEFSAGEQAARQDKSAPSQRERR